jgi:hypothetical protein
LHDGAAHGFLNPKGMNGRGRRIRRVIPRVML